MGAYGTISYTYNQIGNLLTNSKVGTYTYNASGTNSTRPHAVTRTRLTTGTETTTITYSYDANGNLSGADAHLGCGEPVDTNRQGWGDNPVCV